jgi:hypothetical protein
MKPKFSLTRLITTVFLFNLLVFFSCAKEGSQNGTPSQQEEQASMVSSESDGEAEIIFNGIFDDAMGVNDDVGMAGTGVFGRTFLTNTNGGSGMQRLNGCITVTITHPSNTVFPARVVIDFGTAGCLGNDLHVRKGKIISEYTNRLIVPGAIATTTFDGFYIDSIKVEGTYKITNTSSLVTTQLSRQFTVDIIDGKLYKPNGNYTEWNSHKVITQIEGLLTPDYPRDDIFKIEGSAHGKVKKGSLLVAWESAIIEPLIKKFFCPWIVKGSIKTTRVNTSANSAWVAVLDFGNGDCDKKAVITINGTAHNITLH